MVYSSRPGDSPKVREGAVPRLVSSLLPWDIKMKLNHHGATGASSFERFLPSRRSFCRAPCSSRKFCTYLNILILVLASLFFSYPPLYILSSLTFLVPSSSSVPIFYPESIHYSFRRYQDVFSHHLRLHRRSSHRFGCRYPRGCSRGCHGSRHSWVACSHGSHPRK